MRFFAIGILTAALATAACDHPQAAGATTSTSVEQPGDAGSAGSADAASSSAVAAGGVRTSARETSREITIPAGTQLPIVLDTPVASNTSRVEAPVRAHLARAIVVRGLAALPEGSRVDGVVADAKQSGRVKGRAHVALRFNGIVPRGTEQRYEIRTAAVGRTAPGTKKKDALEIGAPAAGGALIGALVGGKKGALIGGAAGGGAGTAVVLSTRGKEVRLAQGTRLTLRLVEPVTVHVRSAQPGRE